MRFYVSIIELADRYHPEEGGYYAYDRIVLDSASFTYAEAARCELIDAVLQCVRNGWTIDHMSNLARPTCEWLRYEPELLEWVENCPCVELRSNCSHDRMSVIITTEEQHTEYHEYC